MNSPSSPVACALAALLMLLMLAATPAYGKGSSCGFSTTGTTGMNFGTLDQIAGGTVTATATLQVGDCNKTMLVTVDSINQTMTRIGGGGSFSYTVSNGTFAPGDAAGKGNGAYNPVTITGTIDPVGGYRDAPAGDYTGSVTVTVSP